MIYNYTIYLKKWKMGTNEIIEVVINSSFMSISKFELEIYRTLWLKENVPYQGLNYNY